MRKSKPLAALFAAAFLGAAAESSPAALIVGAPSTTGSAYTVDLQVDAVDPDTAELTFLVENTTAASVGGYLTALVFNNPGAVAGASLTSTSVAGMTDFYFTAGGINAAPLGDFDFAIGLSTANQNNVFEGGGPAANGLALGGTATFVVTVTGTGVGSLTADDFLGATNGSGWFFAARFRGLTDGGSDKVAGLTAGTVPEPASVALMGLGLAGVAGLARHRRAG